MRRTGHVNSSRVLAGPDAVRCLAADRFSVESSIDLLHNHRVIDHPVDHVVALQPPVDIQQTPLAAIVPVVLMKQLIEMTLFNVFIHRRIQILGKTAKIALDKEVTEANKYCTWP